jgi:hypothetical protein
MLKTTPQNVNNSSVKTLNGAGVKKLSLAELCYPQPAKSASCKNPFVLATAQVMHISTPLILVTN